MQWTLDSERPVYLQLIEQIQAGIISGQFLAGDKLPSVRELAADAMVNPNTMQKALAELERTGLLYSQRTSGRFITTDQTLIRQLRQQQALQIITAFLEKMQQLGFDAEQTIALIRQAAGQTNPIDRNK